MKKVMFPALLLALVLLLAGCGAASAEPAPTVPETTAPAPAVLDVTDSVNELNAYLELAAQYPDTRIIWSVPFSAGPVRSDASSLQLSKLAETDLSLLVYLPDLQQLDLRQADNWDLTRELISRYPQITVDYTVPLGPQHYPGDTSGEILLEDPDPTVLLENLPYLPMVSQVTLTGNLPDTAALISLKETFPGVIFLWEFDFLGIPVTTLTESIDISGMPLSDTAEIEALLPCFYQLASVDMCDCGLSNEIMDGLNQRHKGTQFVWKVQIGFVTSRTDAIYFMPAKFGISWMRQEQTENLKYLTKLQVLDLGHYEGITDVSFLRYMPELRVLSLNSATFTDFTPIGTCQNLEFFEMFLAKGTDLWPLTNCTSLKNLNLSYMPYCDPLPLCQMTWLDRLWISGSKLSEEEKRMLEESLPNTIIVFNSSSSTGNGWRYSPSYYEGRDILKMNYMTR